MSRRRWSQDLAFDELRDLLDPEGKAWWTMGGLITFTMMARAAADLPHRSSDFQRPDGAEIRYWLTVYARLRACRP